MHSPLPTRELFGLHLAPMTDATDATDATDTPATTTAPADGLHHYDGPVEGEAPAAFQAFVESPAFAAATAEMTASLDRLRQFAQAHALPVGDHLDTFQTRLTQGAAQFYRGYRAQLYGEGKRRLERFCDAIEDERKPIAGRIEALRSLGHGLTKCAPRVVEELLAGVLLVNSHDGSLQRRALEALRDIARQQAIWVAEHPPAPWDIDTAPGMDQHVVCALLQETGIPGAEATPPDPLYNRDTDKFRDQLAVFRERLATSIAPAPLARHLAEQLLTEVSNDLTTWLEGDALDLAGGERVVIEGGEGVRRSHWGHLTTRTLPALGIEGLDPAMFVVQDQDGLPLRLHRDAALIAVALRQRLADLGIADPPAERVWLGWLTQRGHQSLVVVDNELPVIRVVSLAGRVERLAGVSDLERLERTLSPPDLKLLDGPGGDRLRAALWRSAVAADPSVPIGRLHPRWIGDEASATDALARLGPEAFAAWMVRHGSDALPASVDSAVILSLHRRQLGFYERPDVHDGAVAAAFAAIMSSLSPRRALSLWERVGPAQADKALQVPSLASQSHYSQSLQLAASLAQPPQLMRWIEGLARRITAICGTFSAAVPAQFELHVTTLTNCALNARLPGFMILDLLEQTTADDIPLLAKLCMGTQDKRSPSMHLLRLDLLLNAIDKLWKQDRLTTAHVVRLLEARPRSATANTLNRSEEDTVNKGMTALCRATRNGATGVVAKLVNWMVLQCVEDRWSLSTVQKLLQSIWSEGQVRRAMWTQWLNMEDSAVTTACLAEYLAGIARLLPKCANPCAFLQSLFRQEQAAVDSPPSPWLHLAVMRDKAALVATWADGLHHMRSRFLPEEWRTLALGLDDTGRPALAHAFRPRGEDMMREHFQRLSRYCADGDIATPLPRAWWLMPQVAEDEPFWPNGLRQPGGGTALALYFKGVGRLAAAGWLDPGDLQEFLGLAGGRTPLSLLITHADTGPLRQWLKVLDQAHERGAAAPGVEGAADGPAQGPAQGPTRWHDWLLPQGIGDAMRHATPVPGLPLVLEALLRAREQGRISNDELAAAFGGAQEPDPSQDAGHSIPHPDNLAALLAAVADAAQRRWLTAGALRQMLVGRPDAPALAGALRAGRADLVTGHTRGVFALVDGVPPATAHRVRRSIRPMLESLSADGSAGAFHAFRLGHDQALQAWFDAVAQARQAGWLDDGDVRSLFTAYGPQDQPGVQEAAAHGHGACLVVFERAVADAARAGWLSDEQVTALRRPMSDG